MQEAMLVSAPRSPRHPWCALIALGPTCPFVSPPTLLATHYSMCSCFSAMVLMSIRSNGVRLPLRELPASAPTPSVSAGDTLKL